jgi:hypothetical protein
MGSLGTTQFVPLILAVAVAAAACGFIASMVVRRNKLRTRGIFLVGFFCGLTAVFVAHRKWNGTSRLAVRALSSSALPVRLGLLSRRRHGR